MYHYSMLNALTYPINNSNYEMNLKILHVRYISVLNCYSCCPPCSVWCMGAGGLVAAAGGAIKL